MEVKRALAISQVAQAIIDSAKVEVALLKTIGGSNVGTDFLSVPEESRELPKIVEANKVEPRRLAARGAA
ncbi:MAG TPA: hypothetical protein VG273_16385 [Bryobacteraceae bacterium]|jgi:hypothetical protein|nr:hypothetical protein [Bryobacteraceae bacterium]